MALTAAGVDPGALRFQTLLLEPGDKTSGHMILTLDVDYFGEPRAAAFDNRARGVGFTDIPPYSETEMISRQSAGQPVVAHE